MRGTLCRSEIGDFSNGDLLIDQGYFLDKPVLDFEETVLNDFEAIRNSRAQLLYY